MINSKSDKISDLKRVLMLYISSGSVYYILNYRLPNTHLIKNLGSNGIKLVVYIPVTSHVYDVIITCHHLRLKKCCQSMLRKFCSAGPGHLKQNRKLKAPYKKTRCGGKGKKIQPIINKKK